jgi:hypothetical protein
MHTVGSGADGRIERFNNLTEWLLMPLKYKTLKNVILKSRFL